jgi:hypothetical protein
MRAIADRRVASAHLTRAVVHAVIVAAFASCTPPPANTTAAAGSASFVPTDMLEYPSAVWRGDVQLTRDPIDKVRPHYSRERLGQMFEVLQGYGSAESPLHVRDASRDMDYLVAVYERDGVTIIRISRMASPPER